MGGDPGADPRLTQRLLSRGMEVGVVMLDKFRRSNSADHAKRVKAIRAAQTERERVAACAQEDALRVREAPRALPVLPLLRTLPTLPTLPVTAAQPLSASPALPTLPPPLATAAAGSAPAH